MRFRFTHEAGRGYYRESDLQVFNQGRLGGAYWFQLFVSRLRWSPPIAALFPGDGSRARARQSPVLRS
ncbi:MAG TPA: hypothetical protein VD758_10685, partial [Gemmatimonadaceae bacterium]|nr:hypothetical protein [Gemmatimonadaceae bacterium]